MPALKYCKSDAFKEVIIHPYYQHHHVLSGHHRTHVFIILQDHWTELLQGKLQLSKDIRVEKLRVEHFLSRLDILMEPATLSFVKSLQARYNKPSIVMMLLVTIV